MHLASRSANSITPALSLDFTVDAVSVLCRTKTGHSTGFSFVVLEVPPRTARKALTGIHVHLKKSCVVV